MNVQGIEMVFLPAELAKGAMTFSHTEGAWFRVRISGIALGHVIQFLFLVVRSNSCSS